MSAGRKYLSKREWDALLESQGGTCCVEECESTGPFIGEHSTCNYYKPGKPDQLMCYACEKAKTRKDRREIARVKRLNGDTLSQHERRKRFGPSLKSRNTFQDRRQPR